MKRLLAQLACCIGLVTAAEGGTYQAVERNVTAVDQPMGWYRSGEFNVQLWGTYAFTANHYNFEDRYLGADHAWGGGLDLKYFVTPYFAVGLSGYAVSARQTFNYISYFAGVESRPSIHNERIVGAGLATATVRYPIAGSRFAPYGYAGVGAIAGGGEMFRSRAIELVGQPPGTNPLQPYLTGSKTEAVGQIGGGLEIRLTPNVGIINDFNWNVVNGESNNFGMVRSGLNFAF